VSRLVVASFNRAKAVEVAEILAAEGLAFAIVPLSGFPGVTLPPETGDTFAANALAKARAAARGTGFPAVADDSGLEVDALHGQPGVMSARYAGETAGDEDRYRKVLALMANVPDAQRTARFRCAAAFVDPNGLELLAEGTVEGRIARAPAGSGGFGYDPIFLPEGRDVTMAQLTPEEKHAISHRGRAFRALARLLRERERQPQIDAD
jgi:XTP/dITP diphosphohydrolase